MERKMRDFSVAFITSNGETRGRIKDALASSACDAEEMARFKKTEAYRLICEYLSERKEKALEQAFRAVNNGQLPPDAVRDTVFLKVCEAKAQSDLLAFFDNTIAVGKEADEQLQSLEMLEQAERNESVLDQ